MLLHQEGHAFCKFPKVYQVQENRRAEKWHTIGLSRSSGQCPGCQNRKYSLGVDVFRFTPESGLMSDIAPCPFRATSGLMHRSKRQLYSITSSARCSSDVGTSMPSAFAVFKLITSSNLVGCSTGRSAGFAPLKILST